MVENASSILEAVELIAGAGCSIREKRSVAGGDINSASIITLSNAEKMFLKENDRSLSAMFEAEAAGLLALASDDRETPPVPVPLAWGAGDQSAFLLMELVEPGRLSSGAEFGTALAHLHRTRRKDECGLEADNWIGSTPQMNGPMDSWHDFFAQRRLNYQWKLARNNGYGDSKTDRAMESLLSRLPDILPNLDSGAASILHGDLWGGNWIAGADGRAHLIDPAVYYGHREADIAMTELFGGFPAGFHAAYFEAWPLDPGFLERKDLYNLYHILNHLNLFGLSYWGSVRTMIQRYS
jgi:protein-ribulosamine 3-kinase